MHNKLNLILYLIIPNFILIEILPKIYECVYFESSGWFCDLIHGWVNWTKFLFKTLNDGKMKVKKSLVRD
jgi:hypothetical protein